MGAVRNGAFSRLDFVKGTTAAIALDNVATTITNSGWDNPRLDKVIKTHMMIQRQKRSYAKVDPPTKHQKVLPPEVYRQLLHTAITARKKARACCLGASSFFCMQSCEFSKTSKKDKNKTNPSLRYHISHRSLRNPTQPPTTPPGTLSLNPIRTTDNWYPRQSSITKPHNIRDSQIPLKSLIFDGSLCP